MQARGRMLRAARLQLGLNDKAACGPSPPPQLAVPLLPRCPAACRSMTFERWNTHFSTVVEQTVFE